MNFPKTVDQIFTTRDAAESLIRLLIQHIGDDPNRAGLIETPNRVIAAYEKWFEGYLDDPKDIFKTFELEEINPNESCGLITIKNIAVYSHCEHHLAPFFGNCTISYIPTANKVSGLSKFSRLVNVFARRLQVQERLTNQIADLIFEELKPQYVQVKMTCRHLCMESRGACERNSKTTTKVERCR